MNGDVARALDYFFSSYGIAHLMEAADTQAGAPTHEHHVDPQVPEQHPMQPAAPDPEPAQAHSRSPLPHHVGVPASPDVHANEAAEERPQGQRSKRAAAGGPRRNGASARPLPAAAAPEQAPPRPEEGVIQRAEVDFDALKLDLRHTIEAVMIEIRDKRQARLDLERAGSYIMHVRAIRELLATLEEPSWGSAEDFLKVFPEEHVRAHAKRFLLIYRKFRHERLGDVCEGLTNKELRQIQDAAAAYRLKRRRLDGRGSSSSSSSTDDDGCSDSGDATDDDAAPRHVAVQKVAGKPIKASGKASGKAVAAKPAVQAVPSKGGRKTATTAAGREASISPIGSDENASDASSPTADSDSDSPKQLRRRSTGAAAPATKRRRSKLSGTAAPGALQDQRHGASATRVKAEDAEVPVDAATPAASPAVRADVDVDDGADGADGGGETPPTRMRLSFGGPTEQRQEVRPKRGRTESARHLSQAQVVEYGKREYDNFRKVKELKAYGEFREVYPTALRGEVKCSDATPLVTFPLRFPCIPHRIFAMLDPAHPKQLLAALRLCCSCCDPSPILKEYYCDELVDFMMSERISYPSSLVCTMPTIPSSVLALFRSRMAIAPCDCEDHRRLAEIISCIDYSTRTVKKLVRHRMNVTLQPKGIHEFSVTLHLASVRPRTMEVEMKLRQMVAINNIMEFIAERSHDRSVAARLRAYPMIPNDDLTPLIRQVEALGSHTKLLTAASICEYDEDKPMPLAPAPPSIAVDLKRHQRESLAFMLDKERAGTKDMIEVPVPLCPAVAMLYNPLTQSVRFFLKSESDSIEIVNPVVRGGFLCDEMGLGKTAVILSLIAANPVARPIGPRDRAQLPPLARWSFKAIEPLVPDVKNLFGSDDEDENGIYVCGPPSTQSSGAASSEHAAPPVAPAAPLLRGSTAGTVAELTVPPSMKGAKVCQGTPCTRNLHADTLLKLPLLDLIMRSPYYKQRHELTPIKATLIIVPVSICGQWTLEIKKCAPTLKYLVFHGPERHHFTIDDMQKVDIILTTYETLSAQMRREAEHSVMASFAGRPDAATAGPLFSELLHRTVRNAPENQAQYVETMRQLGMSRPEDLWPLKGFVDFKNSTVLLSRIRFHRVVFDESQKCVGGALDLVIEDLQAVHRWVVTGTPVNQSLTSVGKLFKAIGCRAHNDITPLFEKSFYHDQSWQSIFSDDPCRSTFVALNKYASSTPLGMAPLAEDQMDDLLEFLKNTDEGHLRILGAWRDLHAFSVSKTCKQHHWALLHILRRYMIRHEKNSSILADITLPARYEVGVPVVLSADELLLYNNVATRVRESFQVLSRQERIGNRMSRVMMWVDMLQRAALSNTLVSEDRMSTDTQGTANENAKHNFKPIEPMALLEQLSRLDGIPTSATDTLAKMCEVPPEVDDCAVCMCGMVQPTMLKCHHFYCRECVLQVISTAQAEPMCPTCRKTSPNKEKFVIQLAAEPVPEENVAQMDAVKRRVAAAGCSKVRAIIALMQGVWRSEDPTSRFVIFSRFPSFLRMLESRLSADRIGHIVVDGSTSLKKRASLIEDFQSPSSATRVCMVSSRAGNAGLTLTAANHLILVEPGLNESVELQAAARIHRFGQLRPVTIHKLYAMDTIEEQIFQMASRKELAGQGANQDGVNASVEQAKRLLS